MDLGRLSSCLKSGGFSPVQQTVIAIPNTPNTLCVPYNESQIKVTDIFQTTVNTKYFHSTVILP